MVCVLLKHLKKAIHRFPERHRTFLPIHNGLLQAVVSIGRPLLRCYSCAIRCLRPNVERNTEAAAFLPDIVIADHPGKAVFVAESLVGGDDALDVVFGEEYLRPLSGHFIALMKSTLFLRFLGLFIQFLIYFGK